MKLKPDLGLTKPPNQWIVEVKQPGREADRSPPIIVENKKTWIYTSTFLNILMM
jgi:hypothetical protein